MTQPPENHQPGGQFNVQPGPQGRPAPQGTPLPQDLSAGWLPEDKRQKPVSPLPEPRFFAYQSILPTKVLHALRHPAEIPWLVAAYAVTAAGYVVLFMSIIKLFSTMGQWLFSSGSGEYTGGTSSRVASSVQDIIMQAVSMLVLGPLVLFIGRALFYAQQRVNGVRITPTQFPEAYQMLAERTRRVRYQR